MSTAIIVATGVPLSPPVPSLKTKKYFVPEVYDQQIHEWHKRPFLMLTTHGDMNLFWQNDIQSIIQKGVKIIGYDNIDSEGLVLATTNGNRIIMSTKSGNIRDGQAVFLSGVFLSKVYDGCNKDFSIDFRKWVRQKVGVDLRIKEEVLVMNPQKPAEDGKQYKVYFGRIRSYQYR
mmetsp:Transcript_4366/g.6295  ORF Transcript_4366/g.6295 Transcript_4366/m.6295 type:complete len:175 (-) Transcript_4366:220-744(-)